MVHNFIHYRPKLWYSHGLYFKIFSGTPLPNSRESTPPPPPHPPLGDITYFLPLIESPLLLLYELSDALGDGRSRLALRALEPASKTRIKGGNIKSVLFTFDLL